MKFNDMIYDLYQLNINEYFILPSLSVAIFRAHYLKKNSIVEIAGQIYYIMI